MSDSQGSAAVARKSDEFSADCLRLLRAIYAEGAADVLARLQAVIAERGPCARYAERGLWDQGDILLITYGDSILDDAVPPLQALADFIHQQLQGCLSGIHVLPFFPYSSDDGFAVIDFEQVNPVLGDWDDIRRLGQDFDLMFDLVINHVSRECLWFADFLGNNGPGRNFFIEVDPETDLSAVVRPRNTPLLVPVQTRRGTRHLWATFSEDQIDLDFSNPDVLVMMVAILIDYLHLGARLVRLDAIAYLWKEIGTSCIHLPQTHAVVKLLRRIMDEVAPGALLLTETNVPNAENLSYFGRGEEAHMVYQFTLPPLLLHTMVAGDARALSGWAASLPGLPENCTFFNFTASHDGIGVRALEGILESRDVADLVDLMHRFGGFVSMKANTDGSDSPYEINIAWFDAMQGTRRGADQWQVQRFLCSQAVMLGLKGIPAVYLHSLTATPNDIEGVERTGRLRSINRRRWQRDELEALLQGRNTPNSEVFNEMRRMLTVRRQEPCFHPSCAQRVVDAGAGFFAIVRERAGPRRTLLALHNVTDQRLAPSLQDAGLDAGAAWQDLLGARSYGQGIDELELQPYQSMWLLQI